MVQFVAILLHVGGLVQMVKDGKVLTQDIIAGHFQPADVMTVLKDALGLIGIVQLPANVTAELTQILNSLITGLGEL